MAEPLKICRDRVLPRDMHRPRTIVASPTGRGPMRAVFEFRKMWITGSTLRVRFLEGTPEQQAIAKREALRWTEHANLEFEFTDALDADLRVGFDPDDGAWSWVGTDAQQIPQGERTINLGFLDPGTAAHEFGHAIGLGHEHQNPAGGIEWNEEAVIRDLKGPPNYWTVDQIRQNVLEKYRQDQIRGTEFDPKSVMLYFFPGAWVKSGVGTNANEDLSALDAAFIASEDAYPRKKPAPDGAVALEVGAQAVRGELSTPGEEDVYTFTAKEPGRYVAYTSGQTDVVMKLFGPALPTRLVAEDDDGGVGANARIVAHLVPGRYWVQLRHYSALSGTGPYTVRVTR